MSSRKYEYSSIAKSTGLIDFTMAMMLGVCDNSLMTLVVRRTAWEFGLINWVEEFGVEGIIGLTVGLFTAAVNVSDDGLQIPVPL